MEFKWWWGGRRSRRIVKGRCWKRSIHGDRSSSRAYRYRCCCIRPVYSLKIKNKFQIEIPNRKKKHTEGEASIGTADGRAGIVTDDWFTEKVEAEAEAEVEGRRAVGLTENPGALAEAAVADVEVEASAYVEANLELIGKVDIDEGT